MNLIKNYSYAFIALMTAFLLVLSCGIKLNVNAASETKISYIFSGNDKNTASHAWGYDSDKLFNANGDGTYSFDYTAADSNNLSFNIYNTKTKTYNCVSESQSFTYSAGTEKEYTLTSGSSKGKSITVKELTQGKVLKLTYTPSSNSIKILCE